MSTTTDRTEDLFQAIDNFLQAHQAWSEDENLPVLTEEYEQALVDMFNEFSVGDMPGGMRDFDRSVENLRDEWEAYEGYVSKANPQPNPAFWSAVSRLRAIRQGAMTPDDRPLESVQLLSKQGVTPHQIAIIYSHNGTGPFLRNGIPQLHLVEQEISNPGSIITPDFIHPSRADQARKSQEAKERWKARTAAARSEPAKPGTESFEDLLRQGLSSQQIATIKCCGTDEVEAEAAKLGIKPADPVNLTTLRAPHEPMLSEAEEKILNSNRPSGMEPEVLPQESFDEEEEADKLELDDLERKALQLSDDGMPTTQIAKTLDMKTTSCATMLKAAKKKREEALASG